MAGRPGRWSRITGTRGEVEAAELRAEAESRGSTMVAECDPGRHVTVSGVLRSVVLRPSERVPAVEAELYDGSGHLHVVWLGRRRIRGIEPGRMITVHGRVTCGSDRPEMFNPRYELKPLA